MTVYGIKNSSGGFVDSRFFESRGMAEQERTKWAEIEEDPNDLIVVEINVIESPTVSPESQARANAETVKLIPGRRED